MMCTSYYADWNLVLTSIAPLGGSRLSRALMPPLNAKLTREPTLFGLDTFPCVLGAELLVVAIATITAAIADPIVDSGVCVRVSHYARPA